MSESQPRPCCAASRPPSALPADAAAPVIPVSDPRRTAPSPEGMVLLPGGEFLMGTDGPEANPADGEGPVRRVHVRPFHIDACAITNAQFATFIQDSGYRTEAERFGWSFVFFAFVPKRLAPAVTRRVAGAPWWWAVEGANWQAPEGPGSHVRKRGDHPVVHVSWNDAMAYCAWAGKRLPTEAEWEYAARGGLSQTVYAWGDELTPGGRHHCNIWQGKFPDYNTLEDGYAGTAPARSFPPNGYGLYNVAGNVWEWCADWFSPRHRAADVLEDPQGPEDGTAKVIRGGSYLCHRSYCNRYRVAARTSNTPDSSTGNMGFRCVADS